MPEIALLLLFVPTMFFVSITPGMCMSLAMTLGLYIGVKRTMWMMLGEVIGVATVAISAVLAIAAFTQAFPLTLSILKGCGAAYLVYLGIQAWVSTQDPQNEQTNSVYHSAVKLMAQGFITAITNPKGWAFMVALLPPLMDSTKSTSLQLLVFVSIIMLSEFFCMMVYASSGRALRAFFTRNNNYIWMNRITGVLLIGVGVWLVMV